MTHSTLRRALFGSAVSPPPLHKTTWLLLRGLGVVSLVAHLSAWTQIHLLAGTEGLLPVRERLRLAAESGQVVPSFFHLSGSDAALHLVCAAGCFASLGLAIGSLAGPCAILAWTTYLSITHTGVFFNFAWDSLLLESLFLSWFAAPWSLLHRPGRAIASPAIGIWLFRWLVFRLMFLSGWSKWLTGDEAWRDGSAMTYHYLTQPLPNAFSPFFHSLPTSLNEATTWFMFFVEIPLAFLILFARIPRLVAFIGIALLQVGISVTGNYGFFNLLSLVLCISLLDDGLLPTRLARQFPAPGHDSSISPAPPGRRLRWSRVATHGVRGVLAGLVLLVSLAQAAMLPAQLSPSLRDSYARSAVVRAAIQLTSRFQDFRSINNYHLFPTMTRTRPEITIEGSHDGTVWEAYVFRCKPGPLDRRPPLVAPHMPRVDWQMWFAALWLERVVGSLPPSQDAQALQQTAHPFLVALLIKILKAPTVVESLWEHDPFATAPPSLVRLRLHRYEYANEPGQVWSAQPLRPFTVGLRRDHDGSVSLVRVE